MTPQQLERAWDGLQERIDKIVKKYEIEKEQIYFGDSVKKHPVKSLKPNALQKQRSL